jgi:hypothetical protein
MGAVMPTNETAFLITFIGIAMLLVGIGWLMVR